MNKKDIIKVTAFYALICLLLYNIHTTKININKEEIIVTQPKVVSPEPPPVVHNNDSLFDVAVGIIKSYEGWHSAQHYPYVGYGHQLLPSDNFDHNISEEFATEVLKKDLKQKISEFREYGKDSLLLGVLAYNIGEWKIKGGFGYKESNLSKVIKNNQRHLIKQHYTSFRLYKGKVVKSIERRRHEEFSKLFIK